MKKEEPTERPSCVVQITVDRLHCGGGMFVAGEVVALLQHGRNPCPREKREEQKQGRDIEKSSKNEGRLGDKIFW